jgi:hypothetical protein
MEDENITLLKRCFDKKLHMRAKGESLWLDGKKIELKVPTFFKISGQESCYSIGDVWLYMMMSIKGVSERVGICKDDLRTLIRVNGLKMISHADQGISLLLRQNRASLHPQATLE